MDPQVVRFKKEIKALKANIKILKNLQPDSFSESQVAQKIQQFQQDIRNTETMIATILMKS